MITETLVLVLVIVTAIGFDFTNGFHDTGNAMATSIATGALKPRPAVTLSAILNLIGAFLSVKVAITITKKILIFQQDNGDLLPGITSQIALLVIFAGLIGGITWNLLSWLFGLPTSSSHSLFGGLIGASLASQVVKPRWEGIISNIIVPALFSPVIAGIVAAFGTWSIYRIIARIPEKIIYKFFTRGQIATASLISLAHGTGDAQKTMGVIALALVATHHLDVNTIDTQGLPWWIIFVCATAIALGTFSGGWRVIRTMGKGLVDISPPQGMAADASSSAIILTSAAAGMALSTTHIATGSILGSGTGKPNATVRWSVAGRMASGWLLTMPSAAMVGAVFFTLADLFPDNIGSVVIFIILLLFTGYIFYRAHQDKIDASNVTADYPTPLANNSNNCATHNYPDDTTILDPVPELSILEAATSSLPSRNRSSCDCVNIQEEQL